MEGVRIFSADGQTVAIYPELTYRTETVPVNKINAGIGIQESAEKIASLLTRMCLKSVAVDDGQRITVEVSHITAYYQQSVFVCNCHRQSVSCCGSSLSLL